MSIKEQKVQYMTVQIMCINKDGGNHQNPHEAISHYGWAEVGKPSNNGKASRAEMVRYLEVKGNFAYVTDGVSKAYCYVRTNDNGTKFLQTVSDGKYTDNLLSLSECK